MCTAESKLFAPFSPDENGIRKCLQQHSIRKLALDPIQMRLLYRAALVLQRKRRAASRSTKPQTTPTVVAAVPVPSHRSLRK